MQSFEAGRRVWLTGSTAIPDSDGRWKQEGPLVALRRPSRDLWSLAAEPAGPSRPSGTGSSPSLPVGALSVAIEASDGIRGGRGGRTGNGAIRSAFLTVDLRRRNARDTRQSDSDETPHHRETGTGRAPGALRPPGEPAQEKPFVR
jgi:hypothetical protein